MWKLSSITQSTVCTFLSLPVASSVSLWNSEELNSALLPACYSLIRKYAPRLSRSSPLPANVCWPWKQCETLVRLHCQGELQEEFECNENKWNTRRAAAAFERQRGNTTSSSAQLSLQLAACSLWQIVARFSTMRLWVFSDATAAMRIRPVRRRAV